MQLPPPIPATGALHQLPNRMKNSSTNGTSATSAPCFHHFFDRNHSTNNGTNALLFNPLPTLGENVVSASTKRPRSNNINSNISNNNNNNNSSSLVSSFVGYPPPVEPDRSLPDFTANWGFPSRNVTRGNAPWTSNALSLGTTTTAHRSTMSNGAGMGGSPNGASMFMDSFLPDYDSTLYSLWSVSGGGSGMGYETENEASTDQAPQVQPPLYMTSDDELKMDYPQLPEFHQDLDSYLNDTMESGGPSPTTPLGTSTASSVLKMDQLVNTDRRIGSHRESQLEMLLAPATAAEYLVKRDRATIELENGSGRSTRRFRGGYNDAYTATPITSGAMVDAAPSGNSSSFRALSRSPTMEPKQRGAAIPSLISYHSGPMATPATKSQVGGISSGTVTLTAIVTPTSTSPDMPGANTGKRPRSRQCEFPGCQNRARSHQKCKKHGGAHQCVFEGCTKNSQSRGLCIAHGGGSRCKKEGCVRAAQSKGLCKSHGGGEYCAVEGCNKKAHLKHLCRTHGGGVRCKFEKCSKWAQRKGWCMAHAKEFAAP